MDSYSFYCSACGKCCNSPPQMSVPELFRLPDLFVGSLAIRRVKRIRARAEVHLDGRSYTFDDNDRTQSDALSDRLLHRAPQRSTPDYDFAIYAQGFDYASIARCPALTDEARCSIHGDAQPVTCKVVPMDALWPDRLQHVVLASRNRAENLLYADCIVKGYREGFTPTTRGKDVIDQSFCDALARRRAQIAADKLWWGNAVFDMLRNDLFASPAESARIPFDGYLFLSLVPVLAVVADISEACRRRCIEYVEAQLALIERMVKQAILRQNAQDKQTTQQLRAWITAYQALRKSLSAGHASMRDPRRQAEGEAWLSGGLAAFDTLDAQTAATP